MWDVAFAPTLSVNVTSLQMRPQIMWDFLASHVTHLRPPKTDAALTKFRRGCVRRGSNRDRGQRRPLLVAMARNVINDTALERLSAVGYPADDPANRANSAVLERACDTCRAMP